MFYYSTLHLLKDLLIKLGKSVIHILASQIRKDKNNKSCLNSV